MNNIAATSRVTVPFEAKDLISGAVRNMRSLIQRATDDVREFRRIAGSMGDDIVSSSRRARDAADDLGRRIHGAADEVRDFNRVQLDDIFRRSRAGADDLRRSASHADAEIRGISDAHVRLRANDEISPLVDGISAKIAALATVAGGLVLGGGMSDALFGGVTDYYSEAARSAPYMPAQERQKALAINDDLVSQGIIPDRATGAGNLADIAPMFPDKSIIGEAITASSKIQYIRPDAGAEEVNRALAQASNAFKETPTQIADSMMYAYQSVGDRQQDLFDTFWEYSPYFASSGTDSAQMSNFLSKTVQGGAFNFDKPGDFFKETFGVKALNADDMANYFVSRGSGKKDAANQAQAFTEDINSGDKQKAQGAIAALVADLASQSRSDLKQSLVTLGAAAAEDNSDSILSTYSLPFEKAPDMTGTTDRLVATQQQANPMTEYNQIQAQMQIQMQDIGGNIMQASLPALKEFNTLITENKDSIEAFGVGVVNAITKVTSVYKENAGLINAALIGLASVLVIKGLVSFGQGVRQLNSDLAGAVGWAGQKGKNIVTGAGQGLKNGWDRIRGRSSGPTPEPTVETPAERANRIRNQVGDRRIRGDLGRNRNSSGNPLGGVRSSSTMTINANRVNVYGSSSGGRGNGRNRGNRRGGGGNNRGSGGDRNRNRNNSPDTRDPNRRGSRENPYRVRRPNPPTPPPTPDVPNGGKLGNFIKSNAKMLKAGGIIGAATSLGFGAYDLYQTAKETGWKEAISSSGGSVAGGAIGGTLGGIVGSLAGPLGTAAGAYFGNWAGEKLGALADSSGITRDIVDGVSSLTDSIKGWMGFGPKVEPKPVMPQLPKESFVTTTASTTKEGEQKIKETMESVVSNVQKSGLKQGLTDAMNESGVTEAADHIKDKLIGMFKGSESKEAENNVKAVGTAAKETEQKAKDLGVTTKNSTRDIISGNGQTALSFSGVSSSAKSAIDLTRQHLESLSTVSSKGSTWGSNLISMMAAGMQSKFPTLTSIVSKAAGVIKDYLGFSSPTKEGPASKSDRWAGNFVSMFSDGLRPDSIKQRMNLIAGTMRDGVEGIEGPELSGSNIPVRTTSLSAQASSGNKSVTIGNVTIDLGGIAAGITDFQSFAKALTSPEGRALIRDVAGEEIYKALETGG
ncbi:tail tape measure protein [Paenibacillus amylolyticus]|uniref:tail tape measure protein n=1 Tax=Paenibacillus amylolyticus TaxID=1451 RepID=UPI003F7DE71F